MDVQINGWAVLLAALSSMVVGSLWYMPATFGNAWQRLSKVKIDRSKALWAVLPRGLLSSLDQLCCPLPAVFIASPLCGLRIMTAQELLA